MDCKTTRKELGRYLDEELESAVSARIEDHLAECPACNSAFRSLQSMVAPISKPANEPLPANLWEAIEDGLKRPGRADAIRPRVLLFMRPIVVAASIVLVAGLGLVSTMWPGGPSQASAATIDFGLMLNELHLDPRRAFDKFLVHYGGREIEPSNAHMLAPELNFAIPAVLIEEYELDAAFVLQFGSTTGIAAIYEHRDTGQLLATVFHAPVHPEHYGTHEDNECIVGKHRGHKVEVGRWKMVHLTDPTTCHCVLSTLDEVRELPDVMSSIAPS